MTSFIENKTGLDQAVAASRINRELSTNDKKISNVLEQKAASSFSFEGSRRKGKNTVLCLALETLEKEFLKILCVPEHMAKPRFCAFLKSHPEIVKVLLANPAVGVSAEDGMQAQGKGLQMPIVTEDAVLLDYLFQVFLFYFFCNLFIFI